MNSMQSGTQKNRIGFHYFPDTLHYREADLAAWLPELKAMAASWLTLLAPTNRAIPESFIRQLVQHQIQPILHFHISLCQSADLDEFSMLCRSYARWGARYAVLYNRPNCRSQWPATVWAQSNLVERFLDIFQPYALATLQAGLIPVFPPLEPGGDYWDTAFLRAAFEGLRRRNQSQLLDRLAISSYAWCNGHSLNWGSGGPEHWPASRPYDTPRDSQDQRGFRIFDWYLAISEAVFGERKPMLILASGSLPNEMMSDIPSPETPHTTQNGLIYRLMMGEKLSLEPVPVEVLACNFWLLAANDQHPAARAAWYQTDGSHLPVVEALKNWVATHQWTSAVPPKIPSDSMTKSLANRPIAHYLLLSSSSIGLQEWQMNIIRTLANKYHPTIGFSPAEAVHARRVTVLGDASAMPDSILDGLIAAGCLVDDLRGDGTVIATKLSNL